MPVREKKRLGANVAPFSCTLFNCMGKTASYNDGTNGDAYIVDPMETKQKLLHLMATVCQLAKTLHGKHAVVCSNFEWFGPFLPHATILTVLEFFGVTVE